MAAQANSPPGSGSKALMDPSNPYAVIVDRNVFHLNPIPVEPVAETPKADLPVIKLSGFLKIGTDTRALFSSVPKDKKDSPTYYNLAEGEKDGILEVVKIHEAKGEVDIVNSGTKATLSLKDDSLAAQGPAAPSPSGKPEHRFSPFAGGFPGRTPGGGRRDFPGRGQFQPGHPNMPFPFPARSTRTPLP